MREILFKAKRLDNGEWVEGTPLFNPDMSKGKILSFAEYLGNDEISFYHYAVDSDTICQYTGINSERGERIFEGDRIYFKAYGLDYIGTVEFYAGAFCVVCDSASPYLDDVIIRHGGIVIGNIHDKED